MTERRCAKAASISGSYWSISSSSASGRSASSTGTEGLGSASRTGYINGAVKKRRR